VYRSITRPCRALICAYNKKINFFTSSGAAITREVMETVNIKHHSSLQPMMSHIIVPRLLFPTNINPGMNDARFIYKNGTYNSSSIDFYQFNHSTTKVSSNHLNESSQVALWSAIIVYFCIIIFISCAGKSSKRDIECCLVSKVSTSLLSVGSVIASTL
jgi:hypothetical protein